MPQRRPAAQAAVALSALAALLAAVALLGARPATGPDAGPDARSTEGSATSPATGPTPGRGAAASTTPPAAAGARSGPSAAASGSPSGPRTPASGDVKALEVLPDQPARSRLPRLGKPATTAKAGDRSEVPVAPRSTVESRTRSGGEGRVQVALVARGAGSAGRVLQFYRVRLGELGYSQRQVPAVAGSSAAGFLRGADSVVVTVTPRDAGGTDYSVLATWGA